MGPVLVKQDQAEAKGTVEKRLEFIRGEMFVLVDVYALPQVDFAQTII